LIEVRLRKLFRNTLAWDDDDIESEACGEGKEAAGQARAAVVSIRYTVALRFFFPVLRILAVPAVVLQPSGSMNIWWPLG
jgi:hypothetical protein